MLAACVHLMPDKVVADAGQSGRPGTNQHSPTTGWPEYFEMEPMTRAIYTPAGLRSRSTLCSGALRSQALRCSRYSLKESYSSGQNETSSSNLTFPARKSLTKQWIEVIWIAPKSAVPSPEASRRCATPRSRPPYVPGIGRLARAMRVPSSSWSRYRLHA
jgi:hypothetical protein